MNSCDIFSIAFAVDATIRGRASPVVNNISPILVERALEQLRQERGIFEQRKSQESRWFYLRLTMGYCSILLLGFVIFVCSYILFNSQSFSEATVISAGTALF